MLYIISLGLGEKDISIKGTEIAKECDMLYLENYTSFGWKKQGIEKFLNKPIISAEREIVESDKLIKQAKNKNICLLVYGDALTATTHLSLIQEAIKQNIPYKIIHGSSVLTAIAETGLSLYKFGATGSIPFKTKNIKSAYELLKNNDSIGLHTLFLLDLNPKKKKYVSISEAVNYLIHFGMNKNRLCIACSNLGNKNQRIIVRTVKELLNLPALPPPCCLIIIGKTNFFENEFLRKFRNKIKNSKTKQSNKKPYHTNHKQIIKSKKSQKNFNYLSTNKKHNPKK